MHGGSQGTYTMHCYQWQRSSQTNMPWKQEIPSQWQACLGRAVRLATDQGKLSYVPCDFSEKPQRGIIRPVRIPSFFPVSRTRMPTECEIFAFPPQTWWLLNLFLVSFDKPSCSQRDIPLTQPLVTVYTGSHQSRRTLSGFDSNIHFASEVQYRKWLDHLSLSLQLLPPSSPTVFPLTLT